MEPLETDLLLVYVWCVSLEEFLVIQFSDETFVLCLDEGFISGSQNELILEFKSSSYKLITCTIEKRENITTSNPLPPYPNKGKKRTKIYSALILLKERSHLMDRRSGINWPIISFH
jgi:hypothetical protein